MSAVEPQCSIRGCIHFRGLTSEPREVPFCVAFPDGIPKTISYGKDKHLKPVKGDHGIQYEGPERK